AIFGALPIAVGAGAGAELRQPLGVAVVGGLCLSQLLTLFITPVVYLYLDRIDRMLKQRLEPQLEEVPHLPDRPALAAEEPRDRCGPSPGVFRCGAVAVRSCAGEADGEGVRLLSGAQGDHRGTRAALSHAPREARAGRAAIFRRGQGDLDRPPQRAGRVP